MVRGGECLRYNIYQELDILFVKISTPLVLTCKSAFLDNNKSINLGCEFVDNNKSLHFGCVRLRMK